MEDKKVSQKWLFLVLGLFLVTILGLAGFFIYQRYGPEQQIVEIRENLKPPDSPTPSPTPTNPKTPVQFSTTSFPALLIVTVEIEPPYQTDASLTPEKQVLQQAEIERTIDEIISELDESKVYGRWESLPFFAIKADEETLDYLINHPSVKDIQEDEVAFPTSSE